MQLVTEIVGWAGAAAMLTAYLSVSMGWFQAGRRFQAANMAASCALVIKGAYHGAMPSVVINIVWFLISVVAFLCIQLRPRIIRPANDAPLLRREPCCSVDSKQ
ncbi:hypothetical protein DAD99_20320 [Pseudarthrobacter sp. AB1]|nr:hypothetical protein [Pseudarthrobacter sp. AB1]